MGHRDSLDVLRLQRGVEYLYRLGPRPTAEAFAEVADQTDGWPAMLRVLARYKRLTPAMVRTAGGDRFPPPPVRQAP